MTDHDPIDRQLDGEPRLPLMARDSLMPGFCRLYAIVRERGPACRDKAYAMLEAILVSNESRDPRPHKDKEHAWSARKIADSAEIWHRQNMRGKPVKGRISSHDTAAVEDARDE